jgi:hypothetical protein
MGLTTTGPALVIPVERIDKRRKELSPEAIQVARELQETPGSFWESPAGAIPRSTAIGGAIGGGLGWTVGGVKPGDPIGSFLGLGDPEYLKDIRSEVEKAKRVAEEAKMPGAELPPNIKNRRAAEEALEAVLRKLKREEARLGQGRLARALGAGGAALGLGSAAYYQAKRHGLKKRLQEELGILGKPIEKKSSEEKMAFTEKDLSEAINSFESEVVAEQVKIAKELTEGAREDLPDSAFALPGRKYPIHDKVHAENALARVSQFGTSAERETVRKKVYAKYPELRENFEEREGESPTSKENVKKEKLGALTPQQPTPPKMKPPAPRGGPALPKIPGTPKTPIPPLPQKPKLAWMIGGMEIGEEKVAVGGGMAGSPNAATSKWMGSQLATGGPTQMAAKSLASKVKGGLASAPKAVGGAVGKAVGRLMPKTGQSIPANIKHSPETSPKEMAKILATQAAMKAKKK